MPQDEEDEFGLSSGDEVEMLAVANVVENGTKRKLENGDLPHSKRIATTSSSATKALKRVFGLEAFRLKQEQVISRILSGSSAAVVFPTGGGKSLCYQIPAIVFAEEDKLAGTRGDGEHGITLIVSPLIALMKDQVDALVRRGVRAATLDSTKSRQEYLNTCEMMRNGELQILYCAPERLNNEGFVQQMRNVRGGIRLLAVDEAHCISEWGHAFRPDYLKISRFVKEIKAERVLCLTATATPRVAQDICKAFDIDESGLFRTSTYRPKLRLLAKEGKTKKDLYPELFSFLRANTGASIVYVTLQKHTEEVASELRKEGFKAGAFHAGLDTSVKAKLQDDFMRSDDLIIVATIAFGMGIDKASIRNVVHMNIPSSIESYSQEIGRAGRDGLTSNCMFYLCGEDLHLRETFARSDLPSKNSIRGLLMDVFTSQNPDNVPHNALPVGSEIKFSHYTQERDYDIRSTALKNIYAQLELTHNLIRATTPIYTKYSYKPSPSFESRTEADKSPAATAIIFSAKKASTLFHIDVDASARHINLQRSDIIQKLNEWNESGFIELKPGGVLSVYQIQRPLPKSPQEIEALISALYSTLEAREQDALHRTDEMMQLITAEACFSRSLVQHFGDELPSGKQECGHCNWCLTHQAVIQDLPAPVEFNNAAFNRILDAVPDRDDPRLLARIAFGISSPRVTQLKLSKSAIFGSMEDHNFTDLLRAFEEECVEMDSDEG